MKINQDQIYILIGKRIRQRRMELGKTQAALADSVKVARTSIANIESGVQQTPVHVLYLVSEELGMQIDELFPSLKEVKVLRELRVKGGELTPDISKIVSDVLGDNKE